MEREMKCTLDEAVKMENMETKMQKRKKLPGFTLIEIIAVMAIIGVMAGALLPSIQTAMNKSEDTEIINNMAMLDSAAKIYKMEQGDDLPSGNAGIEKLKEKKYVPQKAYPKITYEDGVFIGELSSGPKRSDEFVKKDTESGTPSDNQGE